jgi:hypothetical protein
MFSRGYTVKMASFRNRFASLAAVTLVGLAFVACAPMEPDTPTTTTPSTTSSSTTSSTSTTIDPGCVDYTPTSVGLTNPSVSPGDSVTASGTGTPGTTVEITFRLSPNTVVDPGVSAVVDQNGNYSVGLTVPLELTPGTWQVRANVAGCATFATTDVTVV